MNDNIPLLVFSSGQAMVFNCKPNRIRCQMCRNSASRLFEASTKFQSADALWDCGNNIGMLRVKHLERL